MKNFFKNNKIILTNSILVLATITLFLFKKHINKNFYIYLKFSTYFSIAFRSGCFNIDLMVTVLSTAILMYIASIKKIISIDHI